jgi:hypothetical protein
MTMWVEGKEISAITLYASRRQSARRHRKHRQLRRFSKLTSWDKGPDYGAAAEIEPGRFLPHADPTATTMSQYSAHGQENPLKQTKR